MYEVFATITDELGSRTVPTGRGGFLEITAHEVKEEMQRREPGVSFSVEWVAWADSWNSH